MPKKVFYGDPLQLAEIHGIFAGNPKVAVETKKTLSRMGNESVNSKDTKIKGVAMGKKGLVFTLKDGSRHILSTGDEISISKKNLEKRYHWEEPSPIVTTVAFTDNDGIKVTIKSIK